MNKKVQLYSNCIPVRGATRSVICDLQMQTIHYIPDSLYELINEHFGKTPDAIKKAYDNQYDDIINEYLEYLSEKNCVFFTEYPDRFPAMDLQWDYPYRISNAIIDRNENSEYDVFDVLEQLEHLYCKSVQFRFYDLIGKECIVEVLDFLDQRESIISSVEIYLHNTDWIQQEDMKDWFRKYLRISQLCIHNAIEDKIVDVDNDKFIIYTNQKVSSSTHCGVISMNYFTMNLKTFTESYHHNSCLNRKISIDVNGEIKNCPSMSQNFGSIKNSSLEETLNNKDFTFLWNIKKDEIEVCKDCEFRHICTDCRAYVETPENQNSKPLKCGYDPYTCMWEDWSKNRLKQKAIDYYRLREISPHVL